MKLGEVERQFRQDPAYREAERKLKPAFGFGEQVSARMKEQKISWKDLAGKTDLSKDRLVDIGVGIGDLNLEEIHKVADALGFEAEINIKLIPKSSPAESPKTP